MINNIQVHYYDNQKPLNKRQFSGSGRVNFSRLKGHFTHFPWAFYSDKGKKKNELFFLVVSCSLRYLIQCSIWGKFKNQSNILIKITTSKKLDDVLMLQKSQLDLPLKIQIRYHLGIISILHLQRSYKSVSTKYMLETI